MQRREQEDSEHNEVTETNTQPNNNALPMDNVGGINHIQI